MRLACPFGLFILHDHTYYSAEKQHPSGADPFPPKDPGIEDTNAQFLLQHSISLKCCLSIPVCQP